jgi:hypothetical protein
MLIHYLFEAIGIAYTASILLAWVLQWRDRATTEKSTEAGE